jgi:RNA polymerase sigma-70 factor (ECF subfamily)
VVSETEEQPVPSWEEVARTYGRFLYTVAYRLTGNEADAEDLVQEVLLRVRRGLETYRPGSMEGWLSRITTNAFLDDVRRRKRRPALVMADPPDELLPAAPAADEVLASLTLPEQVQAALARLPEDFRAAVVLCDVVGQSYDQIAEILGVPVGTVRSRIHRGRALLRHALGADARDDETGGAG